MSAATIAKVDVVPVAGCHVDPPSVETSTPATRPPMSDAVPVAVTEVPLAIAAPAAGDVIVVVGAVVSADFVAATRPLIRVDGCALMSASRLTVACCIRGSAAAPAPSCVWSRPHAHWMLPAENTRAPEAAR